MRDAIRFVIWNLSLGDDPTLPVIDQRVEEGATVVTLRATESPEASVTARFPDATPGYGVVEATGDQAVDAALDAARALHMVPIEAVHVAARHATDAGRIKMLNLLALVFADGAPWDFHMSATIAMGLEDAPVREAAAKAAEGRADVAESPPREPRLAIPFVRIEDVSTALSTQKLVLRTLHDDPATNSRGLVRTDHGGVDRVFFGIDGVRRVGCAYVPLVDDVGLALVLSQEIHGVPLALLRRALRASRRSAWRARAAMAMAMASTRRMLHAPVDFDARSEVAAAEGDPDWGVSDAVVRALWLIDREPAAEM
jgi:hypothetical protein